MSDADTGRAGGPHAVPGGPERWRPVPGWPGYKASSLGRVRSARGILAPTSDGDGYLRVTLYRAGRRKTFGVHWLVMLAWAGPPEVLHGNGDRSDNRLANLRFGSRLENERDKRGMKERNESQGPSFDVRDSWDR